MYFSFLFYLEISIYKDRDVYFRHLLTKQKNRVMVEGEWSVYTVPDVDDGLLQPEPDLHDLVPGLGALVDSQVHLGATHPSVKCKHY